MGQLQSNGLSDSNAYLVGNVANDYRRQRDAPDDKLFVDSFFMKKLILFSILFLSAPVYSQCVERAGDPCIPVNQSFIDDSTKAFTLLAAKSDTIEKLLTERNASGASLDALKLVNAALHEVLALKDKKDEINAKMLILYEKVIAMQDALIDKMEKRLNKGKGFWDKVLNVIKQVAYIAAGIALGRAGI